MIRACNGLLNGLLYVLLVLFVLVGNELITIEPVDPIAAAKEEVYLEFARTMDAKDIVEGDRLDIIAYVFGDTCEYPVCRITENDGGTVDIFLLAGAILNDEEDGELEVDGSCASSCVLAADLAREKTCVTKRAVFEFHKARYNASYELFGYTVSFVVGFDDPEHSDSINEWVQARGGYPYFGYLKMTAAEALEFWRPCMQDGLVQ